MSALYGAPAVSCDLLDPKLSENRIGVYHHGFSTRSDVQGIVGLLKLIMGTWFDVNVALELG